jgi:hypothetical protein
MSQSIGNGGNGVIMSNTNAVTSNTTLNTSQNWASIGPITINSGVTVQVDNNAHWTII